MKYWSMPTLRGKKKKGGNEVLNAELHGVRAGSRPAGDEKERGVEKKARALWNIATQQKGCRKRHQWRTTKWGVKYCPM